jgi:hypothetical protein
METMDSAWNHVVLAYPIFKSRTTRKKTPNPTTVKLALAQGSPVNTQSKTVAINDRVVEVKECVPKRADASPAILLSQSQLARIALLLENMSIEACGLVD